jgi:hypothetical protein
MSRRSRGPRPLRSFDKSSGRCRSSLHRPLRHSDATLQHQRAQLIDERCALRDQATTQLNFELRLALDLRNNAAECIRLAEAALTPAHKSFFIEMADRWLTLAERAPKTQER